METKICSKCGVEKPNDGDHFPIDRGKLSTRCKICRNEYNKLWVNRNKEKKKKYDKGYRKDNLKNLKKYNNNYNREYEIKNGKSRHSIYWEENKEKIRTRRKKNRERENKLRSKRRKEKRQKDPLFKLKERVRTIFRKSFIKNGYSKNSKTQEILGCSFKEFKSYLESKFEPWMTWDNKGLYNNGEFNYGWDMDHIIPLSTAKTEEDIIQLNHHTNFQPLCSKINRDIKKDNIDY